MISPSAVSGEALVLSGEFLTAVTGRLAEMLQPPNALPRVCSN